MTVLCVEDEEEQLTLRRMIFEAAGFEFLGARGGAQALDLFRTRAIDAVVLDYWMSGMNGLTLATEMKGAAYAAYHHALGICIAAGRGRRHC
jgi:DNA-binding response OmpR family regulator